MHILANSVVIAKAAHVMTILDETDLRILRVLSRDGRISNVDLAGKVGLSPSACLRRVQELERRDIIQGYRAQLNATALGIGFLAYVTVGLSRHTKQEQADFEAAIKRASQVRECHNITGTVEYLLRVETTDLPAYKHFHTEVLGALPQVSTITSYIVMGSPKDERG